MKQLREFQIKSIRHLAKKNSHLICVSPTGSGKSLIYEQLCAEKGMKILLVSPLVALARQQEQSLLQLGISATRNLPSPDTQAWIVSPESLISSKAVSALKRYRPDLLVVDECHCLEEWGENFRPAFLEIPKLVNQYGIARSLWLTATLPPSDLKNLKKNLPQNTKNFGSFALPSDLYLSFARIPLPVRPSQLIDFLLHEKRAGVVFTSTRASAEKVALLIQATGRSAVFYHAGLSLEERKSKERVIEEESRVVVATSAFGMGVHYPHLRWAICYHAPSSPLSLAQSLGRAGRIGGNCDDLLPPRALVFWDEDDFRLIEWIAGSSIRRREALQSTRRILGTSSCRRSALQDYFEPAKTYNYSQVSCQNCDFCSLLSI